MVQTKEFQDAKEGQKEKIGKKERHKTFEPESNAEQGQKSGEETKKIWRVNA